MRGTHLLRAPGRHGGKVLAGIKVPTPCPMVMVKFHPRKRRREPQGRDGRVLQGTANNYPEAQADSDGDECPARAPHPIHPRR